MAARFCSGTDVQWAESRGVRAGTSFVWFSIGPFYKPESIVNRKVTTVRNGLINRRGNEARLSDRSFHRCQFSKLEFQLLFL
jgi:hypothetical protein